MSRIAAAVAVVAAILQLGACASFVGVAKGARQAFLHAGIINTSSPQAAMPWDPWGFSPAIADVPSSLVKLGNECQCSFHSACNCQNMLVFIDCISRACSSGACVCPTDQYHQSCMAMQGACLNLDFECSNDRMKCRTHVEHPLQHNRRGLLEALEEMRVKRCKLKEASEAGWVNADNRIKQLEPKIEDALKKLRALGGEAPDMDCSREHPTVVKGPPVNRAYP